MPGAEDSANLLKPLYQVQPALCGGRSVSLSFCCNKVFETDQAALRGASMELRSSTCFYTMPKKFQLNAAPALQTVLRVRRLSFLCDQPIFIRRSPWVLPIESSARRLSLEAKQRLATAGGGCSDHLALVKVSLLKRLQKLKEDLIRQRAYARDSRQSDPGASICVVLRCFLLCCGMYVVPTRLCPRMHVPSRHD